MTRAQRVPPNIDTVVQNPGIAMSAVIDHPGHGHEHGHEHAHDHPHEDHGAPHGWRRWVYATNHKDIGTLYLLFSFTMLMIGGVLALAIRAELFQPGLQFVNPQMFNRDWSSDVCSSDLGSMRRTTRTSARCTCCSRSRC